MRPVHAHVHHHLTEHMLPEVSVSHQLLSLWQEYMSFSFKLLILRLLPPATSYYLLLRMPICPPVIPEVIALAIPPSATQHVMASSIERPPRCVRVPSCHVWIVFGNPRFDHYMELQTAIPC